MPYVYVPSSSYGGNNPPQVGGYTPARRLRTSRGGALTIAQEHERQRQVALAREKHLLEVEKVRAERAALAKKQQEEQAAARAARQPATTQPSQAGSWYGPNSEEQRRAREAKQPKKAPVIGAPTEEQASEINAAPAAKPTPAPVAAPTTPSVMPSAVYNPNENRNLLDIYGTLDEPSRAAISTYLNAQNRAAVNRQVQDAVAPAMSVNQELKNASTPILPSSPFSRVVPQNRAQAFAMDPTSAPRARMSYDQAVKSLQDKFAKPVSNVPVSEAPAMPGMSRAANANIDPVMAAAEAERKRRQRLESDALIPGAYDVINWPGWGELANLVRPPM